MNRQPHACTARVTQPSNEQSPVAAAYELTARNAVCASLISRDCMVIIFWWFTGRISRRGSQSECRFTPRASRILTAAHPAGAAVPALRLSQRCPASSRCRWILQAKRRVLMPARRRSMEPCTGLVPRYSQKGALSSSPRSRCAHCTVMLAC